MIEFGPFADHILAATTLGIVVAEAVVLYVGYGVVTDGITPIIEQAIQES